MTDRTVKLTRRRLLGGIVAIGGASAATGAGTMAYFSTTAQSTNNEVTAGTLELDFGGTGTFSFSTSLAPTISTQDSVTLVNAGTLSGSVDVDVDYSESDASSAPSPDMTAQEVAENLEVTTLEYGGADLTWQIDTSNSPPTLHDLANNLHDGSETTQNDLINLADPGGGTDFTVEFRLKNVSDDYQGDGVEVTFTFHLNQNDAM